MAILKAINPKKADREKLLASLSYASNPEKLRNRNQEKKAEKFKMQSLVNRMLHGKGTCKRHFKQYVVSLEMKWPKKRDKAEECEEALQRVLHNCQIYFMEQGYMVEAWIHCNTSHPHFHLLLDTCNALSGKQFSKSSLELQDFKNFVSSQLLKAGLNEQVLTNIQEVTEEEMLQYEEENESGNYWDTEEEPEQIADDYDRQIFSSINNWNNGTTEQNRNNGCINVGGGRQMCRIVSDEERQRGRQMCHILSDKERQRGRQMCYIVSKNG